MRPVTATAAAVTTVAVAGIGTAAALARRAVDATLRPAPDRPLPGDPRLTVHAVGPGRVTLTRALASRRPGTYGLTGPGVHAVAGPVIDDPATTPDTVVRRLDAVGPAAPEPGTKVRMSTGLHTGDPDSALGIAYEEVTVPGELGALPAWFVPGTRDLWVIAVHGLGTTRELALNLLPFLHGRSLPVLAVGYRGDPGAPRSPDGLGHLGETEWRDLDAALRYAVSRGARRVVLHGWSTGATMALHTAANSALREHVTGLVLDSPVLDQEAALRALARARHVPGPLVPLVVRAARGRAGLYRDRLPVAADAQAVRVPTLILHGPDDTLAPWGPSRQLAAARPDLVTLRTVLDAPHAAMWNTDPAAYEEALRRFLTPLM
ncbi:alpha/beta hydrolase [Streptomyces sp. NPDC058953]|uniref:alpha/beta hydrolase n=1 Tax=unclassified Streptomyces TaxID=2593676 RepID=UPI00369AA514